MCLYLTVSWIDLQCVIVAFPDHIHFLSHVANIKMADTQRNQDNLFMAVFDTVNSRKTALEHS